VETERKVKRGGKKSGRELLEKWRGTGSDAIPDAAGGEGGHGTAKPEGVIHRYGQTALSRAAMKGHEAVVKLLLEKGADMECRSDGGRTPLWWAAANGHEAVMKLLTSIIT
jgi:Ankyrin repeats (many copies)